MFNREIQNMQVTHKYEMIQGGVQAAAGVVQGAVSGFALGGIIGAIAGGAFAFGSILVDNVQDIIDYKQAYNVQQYEIDLIRQRSGLNSTTNESRTGD